MTSAEDRVAFREINDYVMEDNGLNSACLNITQAKKKCEPIGRENHNMPESENSKQPERPAFK